MSRFRAFAFTLTVFWLVGCHDHQAVLVVVHPTDMLEYPSPLDYPSTNPIPNKIVKHVSEGRLLVIDEVVDKDFKVYRVETDDGVRGFVIANSHVRLQRNSAR